MTIHHGDLVEHLAEPGVRGTADRYRRRRGVDVWLIKWPGGSEQWVREELLRRVPTDGSESSHG